MISSSNLHIKPQESFYEFVIKFANVNNKILSLERQKKQ